MGTRYQGTPEEVRALDAYIKLMRAAEGLHHRLGARLDAESLTPSQFGVLEALLHLGPMCQKDLGRKILKSTGNITMVVDNLEKRGLAQRQRGVEDRRYIVVHLTDEGRGLIARLFPQHARDITQDMRVLEPDEQAELGRLCRKLGRVADG